MTFAPDRIPEPLCYQLPGKNVFTVPPYFDSNHNDTIRLIHYLTTDDWAKIQQLEQIRPGYFRCAYFQVLDSPKNNERPMFHRFAVLYLNVLGMTLYFKSINILEHLSRIRHNKSSLIPWNIHNYVANLRDQRPKTSDLQAICSYSILIRREFFEAVPFLLKIGWKPHCEIVLPYRRPYYTFEYRYRDFVDYCLAQLFDHPTLYLPGLFSALCESNHPNFSIYSYEKIRVNNNGKEIVDWVSIPRRILRYAYYLDKHMSKISNCIHIVKIIQAKRFFVERAIGSVTNIDLQRRLGSDGSEERIHRTVWDQDCVIALLLGMLDKGLVEKHDRVIARTSALLVRILADTMWAILFLSLKPSHLMEYFSKLTENVKISFDSVELAATEVAIAIDSGELHQHPCLVDLKLPLGEEKGIWRESLEHFQSENPQLGTTGNNNKNEKDNKKR